MPGWRRPSGDLEADDAHVYDRELYDAECLAAERLAQLLEQDMPLFKPDELHSAIEQAEKDHQLVLDTDQRRAIATALTRQVSIISGGPGVAKTTSVHILVELLERRGVPYVLLSRTGKAAKRLAEAALREAYTIHRQLFSLDRQRQKLESQLRGPVELFLPGDAVIVDEASWSTCRCWRGCCAPLDLARALSSWATRTSWQASVQAGSCAT